MRAISMSLSKCYQNILTHESVKLNKRPVSLNTLMKELMLCILNTYDDMRNHLFSYDVLTLEASFRDVFVECNETLY